MSLTLSFFERMQRKYASASGGMIETADASQLIPLTSCYYPTSCNELLLLYLLCEQTCLPIDVLLTKPHLSTVSCPSCRKEPLLQIHLLPLPVHILEQSSRCREQDKGNVSSCGSPATSIALVDGRNTRGSLRSYRTGRWANEESAFVDKLIKHFDAGLLPIPHGIKLNG